MRIPFLTDVDEPTLRRYLITGVTVLVAFLLGWALWWHYLRSPWTRDGRVRAEVVDIAAEISGKVIDLEVVDNQQVKKGDVLFDD
jgi:multidrug resistance efflux pump